jgi:hypothetical protein
MASYPKIRCMYHSIEPLFFEGFARRIVKSRQVANAPGGIGVSEESRGN